MLPIIPTLQIVDKLDINLTWKNPPNTYDDSHEVFYNYTVVVLMENGNQTTWNHDVESHETAKLSLGQLLFGQECKHMVINISLPGNCEAKQLQMSLLIG